MLSLPRWLAPLLLALAALTMLAVTSDAEARRFGGGMSFGRQSSNIMKQRQAVKPPAARTPSRAASGQSAAAASGAAAKSGMSRWLGPIAGIAAGLGIAALLSSLGLSGALLEFLSSAILIGLLIWAALFVFRRLRGASPRPATASTGHGATSTLRRAEVPAHAPGAGSTGIPLAGTATSSSATAAHDPSWFIPEDFDMQGFLDQAKQQFRHIQGLWDAGDRDALKELLTDDMLLEISSQLPAPNDGNVTEVVLLNAELLGIETVAGGYLASVRYSGMLRESAGAEAEHFQEIWNLYKPDGRGWLLAGLQQLDLH